MTRIKAGETSVDKEAHRPSCVNAYWDGDKVTAMLRTPDGEHESRSFPAQYVCYLRASDVTEELKRTLRNTKHVAGFVQEGSWWRVTWRNWKILRMACDKGGFFDKHDIPTYEGDVNPVRRWLTDSNVTIARPKRCFLDLETDPRNPIARTVAGKSRILCWSLVDMDGNAVCGVLEGDTDEHEVELLRDLWWELRRFEQVCAWGGDDFDFPVLRERSAVLGVQTNRKRWLWVDHLQIFRRMNMSASDSGDEKQSMSLDAIAKSLGLEGKKSFDVTHGWDAWAAGGETRRKLAEYNVQDAQTERAIEQATGYLELHQTVCEVCTTLPDTRGNNPTIFVDGYLLKLGKARDEHFKTHFPDYGKGGEDKRDVDPFKGAYVMEPTKLGIIEGAHVCDFASLYPSIIISWNLSPETYCPNVRTKEDPNSRPAYLRHLPLKEFPLPPGHCSAPLTNAVFRTDKPGVLPIAIADLLRLRAEWKKRKEQLPPGTQEWKDADRRSSAYKIAANSFYGVMGSVFSRFFERALAESVSTTGEWLLRHVIREAEARGYDGFYGDTDSVFATGCTREEFGKFVDWCNDVLWPRLAEEQRCRENRIKLGYEKEFSVLVMVGKKRYAGRYAHYGGKDATADSKPEIKGLEFKRGDTARLTRNLQREVIEDILFGGHREPQHFDEKIQRWKTRILEEELALEDYVMSKRLSRAINEYSRKPKKDGTLSDLPAHAAIAYELNKKGADIRVGQRISYVVTDASVSPMKVVHVSEYEPGTLDRYYLWEKLVYPATQRVLEEAFAPRSQWKAHGKVRPRKVKVVRDGTPGFHLPAKASKKKSTAPEEQGALFQ